MYAPCAGSDNRSGQASAPHVLQDQAGDQAAEVGSASAPRVTPAKLSAPVSSAPFLIAHPGLVRAHLCATHAHASAYAVRRGCAQTNPSTPVRLADEMCRLHIRVAVIHYHFRGGEGETKE